MNRRKFLIGVAVSAVVPALPTTPVQAVVVENATPVYPGPFLYVGPNVYRQFKAKGYPEYMMKLVGRIPTEKTMILNTTLAGANFRPADAKEFIKNQLTPETVIKLERDANNPYDSGAVKIICTDDFGEEVFIGFVPKVDNPILALALDTNPNLPYTVKLFGFAGTLQPIFEIEFEPPSIEERNAAQDEKRAEEESAALTRAAERAVRGHSDLDDEIPF